MRPYRTWSPILAAIVAVNASGCAHRGLAEASSTPTGCAADDLKISGVNTPLEGPHWWWATCASPSKAGDEGQAYFCSRLQTEVICSDAPPEAFRAS